MRDIGCDTGISEVFDREIGLTLDAGRGLPSDSIRYMVETRLEEGAGTSADDSDNRGILSRIVGWLSRE